MAARRLARGERLLRIEGAEGFEAYEVHTLAPGLERRVLTDVAPAAFVSRVPGEHGEVRVAPLVEALMQRLRRARQKEAQSSNASSSSTGVRVSGASSSR